MRHQIALGPDRVGCKQRSSSFVDDTTALQMVRSSRHADATASGVIRQRGRLLSQPLIGSGASPALIPRRASRP
jgi:hypothetical protein